MTRCPNCGAAIRIGAKFCTSCGFRLTVDEPSGEPSRSPFATTSAPPWAVSPAATAEVVEQVGPTMADEPDVEPAWSKVDDGDLGSTRPVYAADEPPYGRVDEVVAEAGETRDEGEAIEMGAADLDLNDSPGRSWYAPVPPTTSGPISDDMVSTLEPDRSGQPGEDAATGYAVDEDDELFAPAAVESEHDEEVIFVSSIGSNGVDSPEAAPAETAMPVEATSLGALTPTDPMLPAVPMSAAVSNGVAGSPAAEGVTADQSTDDPLAEARTLAARLNELLARMAGGAPTTAEPAMVEGVVPFSSIAEDADVDALRGIVASARERPRDVDVMLDLVLRADTIAAVLADRDLLLAALRGDERAVEEAWPSDEEQPTAYPAWGAP